MPRTCALLPVFIDFKWNACPHVVRRIGLLFGRASLRPLLWNYLKAKKIGAGRCS